MAAKVKTFKNDLIPYDAGVVILDPIDTKTGLPDYTRSVATTRDYLTSTQVSVSRTYETIENGNGQDTEYPVSETYTLTTTGNVYNPIFHGVVSGQIETLPSSALMPHEVTYNFPSTIEEGDTLSLTFGKDGPLPNDPVPAADDRGDVNFIVEDIYGNNLTRLDTPELGAYSYDSDKNALEFSNDYLGTQIRVIYSYASTNVIQYSSNPIIQNPQYQVRVFGNRQSASTGETVPFMEKIARATASGDITGQASQKSKSAPITYTFTSAPVPVGTSVYTNSMVYPSDTTGAAGDDTGTKNIVNGIDDNFTKAT